MSKSETFTETLEDEAGIEILVNYSKEWNDQKEDFHGGNGLCHHNNRFPTTN